MAIPKVEILFPGEELSDEFLDPITAKYFPYGIDDDSGGYDEFGDPIPYEVTPGAW
jgi:hypothetical protein